MWSFFSRDPTKDFPYEIGDFVYESERTIWKMYKGRKKGSGEEVSIFIYDTKTGTASETEVAQAGVKRLKTLRHPNILTFLDSVESDKGIYMATEYVQPLQVHLAGIESSSQSAYSSSWGLFQVTRALSFLLNEGNLRHNNVHSDSVFVNSAGEWKLGGVEFVASNNLVQKHPKLLHQLDPQELRKSGTTKNKWSVDSWGLGILIYEAYHRRKKRSDSEICDKVPRSLMPVYNELTHSNPDKRPSPDEVIRRGRKSGGFFKNDLIDTLLFLEEIQIKEQSEKVKFFNGLSSSSVLDRFPVELCKNKILPELLNAFDFGNAGSSILAPLFKLGRLLDEDEYQAKIVPCVLKLFTSTDRATRVRLLQQIELFLDHLGPSTVNDKIFPNIISGLMDTNPTVREQTVKAMLHLAPKLNHNNLNVELLKHFAKLQVKDDQGGIRTNTTICLGKIACYLHPATRKKVLIPAFTRVFQDSFSQAKVAGIVALAATQQYYQLSEVASKILPSLCPLTFDSDKNVRENAFKTIKGFLGKLEKVSEDPSLKEKYETEVDLCNEAGAAGSSNWATWAVSALTSKFNRSQSIQSLKSGGPTSRHKLGHQSSSSTTSTATTSSSIPSTPSVDRDVLQPTAEGQESTTDYEEDWDNWGAMDESTNDSASTATTIGYGKENIPKDTSGETVEGDGWDTEEFLPLEDVAQENRKSSSDLSANNSWSWNQDDWRAGGSAPEGTSTIAPSSTSNSSSSKHEEMRKRREERRLQRQVETDNRRGTKGPMKLGAKKLNLVE